MVSVYIQRVIVDRLYHDDTSIRWDVLLVSDRSLIKSFSSKKNALSFCMENNYDLLGFLPEGRIYIES